jgi:hypothetical protein
MILSEKDKIFLERLKKLLDEKQLSIEMKESGYRYMVLRQNYGDKIERCFGMTRQGIRWRFHRLFNDVYVGAYETIYLVESNFGTNLRPMALEIVKERVALRKKAQNLCFFDASRRENDTGEPDSADHNMVK